MTSQFTDDDWETVELREVSERVFVGIASSATYAYRKAGVPMFRNQNIKAGRLVDSDLLFLDPMYEQRYRTRRLAAGDLLTARTGYPGVTAVVPSSYEGAQSFTTLITRPNRRRVDSSFLCFYINSGAGQAFVAQSQIGGAQQNLNVGAFKLMPIALPTLEEQRSIAAVLTSVDHLLGALLDAVQKKRAVMRGMMQELLTGQTRLPRFAGEWRSRTYGDVVRIQRGSTMTRTQAGRGQVPVVAGGKNPAGYTDQPNRWGRTITISASGASAGYVRLYDEPIFASDCSTISESNSYDLDFIYFSLVLRQEGIYREQTGGAQPHIHARDVYPMRLHVPSSIEEQRAIAAVLMDASAEIVALERRLEATQSIKEGIMQALLTGRTRLPVDNEVAT